MIAADPGTPRGPRSSPLPARLATVVAVLIVTLLASESLAVLAAEEVPPLTITLGAVGTLGANVEVAVQLRAGAAPVQVHLGLLPGTRQQPRPVYFFADQQYPGPYATYTQVMEVGQRTLLEVPGSFIDANQLVQLIDSGQPATVVVLGGLIPDAIFSNSTNLVTSWIEAGGLLVWAGGPLAFMEGHPSANGPFVWDAMAWAGQTVLTGFPVTDIGPLGPLVGSASTPLSRGLGLTYDGTVTGANASRVVLHGGEVLGSVSSPGLNGSSPRASLAYLPLGAGGIAFFGGSFAAATRPQQFVPLADIGLSADLQLLLGSLYLPSAPVADVVDAVLPAYSEQSFELTLPIDDTAQGAVLLVTSPGIPVPLTIWSTTAVPPGARLPPFS